VGSKRIEKKKWMVPAGRGEIEEACSSAQKEQLFAKPYNKTKGRAFDYPMGGKMAEEGNNSCIIRTRDRIRKMQENDQLRVDKKMVKGVPQWVKRSKGYSFYCNNRDRAHQRGIAQCLIRF